MNLRHTPILKSVISFHSCSTWNNLILLHIPPPLILKLNLLHFPNVTTSILHKIHDIFLVILRVLVNLSLQFHHNVSPFSFILLVNWQLKFIKAVNLLPSFLNHNHPLISVHISLNRKLMARLHTLIDSYYNLLTFLYVPRKIAHQLATLQDF